VLSVTRIAATNASVGTHVGNAVCHSSASGVGLKGCKRWMESDLAEKCAMVTSHFDVQPRGPESHSGVNSDVQTNSCF